MIMVTEYVTIRLKMLAHLMAYVYIETRWKNQTNNTNVS